MGPRCDMCGEGHFGDLSGCRPEQIGLTDSPCVCRRCDCSRNVDQNAIGNCDSKTGVCLKCVHGKTNNIAGAARLEGVMDGLTGGQTYGHTPSYIEMLVASENEMMDDSLTFRSLFVLLCDTASSYTEVIKI